MKKLAYFVLSVFVALSGAMAQPKDNNTMKSSEGKIVRISLGYFAVEQTDKVEALLNNEFKNSLVPAIQKLRGNISYYVGIDREKQAITNVSIWKTKEDALQMATLKEMLDMRAVFEKLGIHFIEITNHEVLWELP